MKLNPFAMMNREMDGSGIVFDPEKNTVLTLNATGVIIWEAIEEGVDQTQILQRLLAEFNVTPDIAQKDLQYFLKALIDKGLLSEE